MMYVHKIKPCKGTVCNFPFTPCPFLHEGEVGRRDLLWHKYSCIPCIHFKNGFCPHGDSCACAHGILEQRFHPMLFRTRFCWYMNSCKRKDCSYAHKEEEKRDPTIAPQLSCPKTYSTALSDIFTNTSSALRNPAIFNGTQSLPKIPNGVKCNVMNFSCEIGDRPSYSSEKPESMDLSMNTNLQRSLSNQPDFSWVHVLVEDDDNDEHKPVLNEELKLEKQAQMEEMRWD